LNATTTPGESPHGSSPGVSSPPAAPDAPPAISVRGLSKTYGKGSDAEQALVDVDLDVATGEFLVLLGPSGCGKTTLLRSIAGLERPDAGSIHIDGTCAFDSSSKTSVDAGRRPVTMIFQSYALWPHMTAAKNVAFPLKCAGVGRAEIATRVDEILTKVGIGHLAHRYPAEMSGGQQQRLALARAVVVGQRVVLFDEPLSNVDAQVREKLRIELIKMQRTIGFTAIYVTHDQSEAMGLADRIAVMAKGRIAQLDRPRQLYQHPETIDVARFLGQSNEIPITVDAYDSASNVVSGGGGPLGVIRAGWDQSGSPAPGESLVAFGRPADFEIVAREDGVPDSPNRWEGRIEAARFFGSHIEYVVQIGESRLRCWVADDRRVEAVEGRPVWVSIDPGKLQAVRA
jgi:iron(III) transport system ATP-binding protein